MKKKIKKNLYGGFVRQTQKTVLLMDLEKKDAYMKKFMDKVYKVE